MSNFGPVTKPTVSGAKKVLSSGDPVEYNQDGDKHATEHPSSDSKWESVDHCSGPVADGDWSHPTSSFPSDGHFTQT
jgi:hypothetical protein